MVEVDITILGGVAVTILLALLFFAVVVLWDISLALRSVGDKVDKLEDSVNDDLMEINHTLDRGAFGSAGGPQLHLSGGTISTGPAGPQHPQQAGAGSPQAQAHTGPDGHPQQPGHHDVHPGQPAGGEHVGAVGPNVAQHEAAASGYVDDYHEPVDEFGDGANEGVAEGAEPYPGDEARGYDGAGDHVGEVEHDGNHPEPGPNPNVGRFATSGVAIPWHRTPLDRDAIAAARVEVAGELEAPLSEREGVHAEPMPGTVQQDATSSTEGSAQAAVVTEGDANLTADAPAADDGESDADDVDEIWAEIVDADVVVDDGASSEEAEPDREDDFDDPFADVDLFGDLDVDPRSGDDHDAEDRVEASAGAVDGSEGDDEGPDDDTETSEDDADGPEGDVDSSGDGFDAESPTGVAESPDEEDGSTDDGDGDPDDREAPDGGAALDISEPTGDDEAVSAEDADPDGATDTESDDPLTELSDEEASALADLDAVSFSDDAIEEPEVDDQVTVDEAIESLTDDPPTFSLTSHDYDATATTDDEDTVTLVFEFDPEYVDISGSSRRLLRYQLRSYADRSSTPDATVDIDEHGVTISIPDADGPAVTRWADAVVNVLDRTLYLSESSS